MSGPRRTSLGGKLLMGCATVALGWVLLPFAPPSPARRVPVEPIVAPEPVAAASDASPAGAPAEPEGQVTTLASGRDAEDHISVGTGKRAVRRWAAPGR